MDFEQIRAFLHVATLKSFSGAAEKMYISQPSVSVRVKALEEDLGVTLLDRSRNREPSLTEAGRLFLDYAQAMVNLQEKCREDLSGQSMDAAGLIVIGASTVPGVYLLPALLAAFRDACPLIDLKLNIHDTGAVLAGVLNYHYDIGFVGLPGQDDLLAYVPLLEDTLVLCARPGLLTGFDRGEGIALDILADQHLIMREKGSATRKLLEKKMAENNCPVELLRKVTEINSLEGVKQAVKEGLGLAVLSRLSVRDMVEAGAIETFDLRGIELRRHLYLVYHHSRVLGGAARSLRDYTINKFTSGS